MNNDHRRTWLIAYDVRNPRRLRRVHKYLSSLAHPLQFSLFVADLSETELEKCKSELQARADRQVDDVRMYCLSTTPRGSWFGVLPGNEDVSVYGSPAANLAKNLAENPLYSIGKRNSKIRT